MEPVILPLETKYAQGAIDLAIVIPTYNERENICSLLAALTEALGDVEWEAIFVDDNSTDGTGELLHEVAADNQRVRLLERIGRRGLSSACIEGMQTTAAPYIAVMDADLQHDERILPVMFKLLKAQSLDVVVGSRRVPGGSMQALAFWRVLLSKLGDLVARVVCRCQLSDAMSGFFVLRRSFFEKTRGQLKGTGFKLLVELLASSAVPPRLAEVPYRFRQRERGRSKFGISVGFAYLVLLWEVSFSRRRLTAR